MYMFASTTLRGAFTALLALVTALAAVIPLSTAHADTRPDAHADADVTEQAAAQDAAAAWIARELDSPEPSFDVFGATSARNDVIYALAGAGGHEGAVRRALLDLQVGAADYLGPPGAAAPGALGKVLLSVLINREDPADFVEGRHLEAELRTAMAPDGIFAADVFNQSLAMIGLGATEGGVPAPATAALLGLQCDTGEFTFSGSCPGVEGSPDVDSTALAIQALLAADETAAAEEAAAFLAGVQNPDGSWPSAFGDPNANSAGVAAHALRATGETEAASMAADFVVSLQTADGGIKFVASDTEANGFATLQGILAFVGIPLADLEAVPYADVPWTYLFATEIDWLGDNEITKGCDPPQNNSFCPDDTVTREQMAAFLVRAFDLTDTGDVEFTDVDGSVFEDDIRKLAAAGITQGCNPPENDLFCPDEAVTRGQMAAFLVRALDLTDTGDVELTDIDGSIFEDDIRKLATAGITQGCNPPENDLFCPDEAVTRAAMAAFIYRASTS